MYLKAWLHFMLGYTHPKLTFLLHKTVIWYATSNSPHCFHNMPKSWFNQQGNVFMDTLDVLSNPIYMTLSSISKRERGRHYYGRLLGTQTCFSRGGLGSLRILRLFALYCKVQTHIRPHTLDYSTSQPWPYKLDSQKWRRLGKSMYRVGHMFSPAFTSLKA